MHVYFMRHGKAHNHSQSGDDRDRELQAEGVEQIMAVGQVLSRMGVRFDHILTSPFLRTVQTGELIADVLGGTQPEAVEDLASGFAKPEHITKALKSRASANAVLIIGHMPEIGEIVSTFLQYEKPLNLKPGSICRVFIHPPFDAGLPADLSLFLNADECFSIINAS